MKLVRLLLQIHAVYLASVCPFSYRLKHFLQAKYFGTKRGWEVALIRVTFGEEQVGRGTRERNWNFTILLCKAVMYF
jgi:hypothetical protein